MELSEGIRKRKGKDEKKLSSFKQVRGKSDKKSAAQIRSSDAYWTRLLGFSFRDFSSWSSFVNLMGRPMDPASLGITRFFFGLLMFIDTLEERGMTHADFHWGDPDVCHFPLINWLQPLPLAWMFVIYLVMLTGTIGIMFGFAFRFSCLLYTVPYWYLFLLDKTRWNNHSYLYGLLSLMMLFSDGHHYWSLDGLLRPSIRNTHVPLRNYAILRTQLFIVYFFAGLKKLDFDWVAGYSMQRLSRHFVFAPFLYVLTAEQVDLWIVHFGGLALDLFLGYVLFFDATRWIGLTFGMMFHGMNSQLFSIGMFPYTMIATMPLFCYTDWPRHIVNYMPKRLQFFLPTLDPPQRSSHCIYTENSAKNTQHSATLKTEKSHTKEKKISKNRTLHNLATIGMLAYLTVQCILPYSHFITKGYNNWTNGLYGYSWDMMVHSWSTQHIRITYKDKLTGDTGYLNPLAFSHSSRRIFSHADMMKQYATCIKQQLVQYNITDVELYFDVWKSLNQRFQQRMIDPNMDIVTADWHPFEATSWVLPLLTSLSDWRSRLDEIQKGIYTDSNDTDAVFIADFPGLSLENFIQPALGNVSLQVLKGDVIVELLPYKNDSSSEAKNVSLSEGESTKIPAGQYHSVHVSLNGPACYMYMFVNNTQIDLKNNLTAYEKYLEDKENGIVDANATMEDMADIYNAVQDQKLQYDIKANKTFVEKIRDTLTKKYQHFTRGVLLSRVAIESLVTGNSFSAVFNATLGDDSVGDDGIGGDRIVEEQKSYDK